MGKERLPFDAPVSTGQLSLSINIRPAQRAVSSGPAQHRVISGVSDTHRAQSIESEQGRPTTTGRQTVLTGSEGVSVKWSPPVYTAGGLRM